MRNHRGQASLEYVAVLALLAVVLAGAGAAVAAPDLPGRVVRQLRVALCIVGMDVCRPADAARRGLDPCVVTGEEHARETGVSLLFIKASGGETWAIERLSDGRVRLSSSNDAHLGGTAGLGLELGPILSAGGSGTAEAGFRKGRTWVLPDEAALRALLARVNGFDLANPLHTIPARFPEPAETYLEGGGRGGAELAASALRGIPGGSGSARAVLGRRTGPGGTTYYLDLGGSTGGPFADLVPGLDRRARVLAEWRAGDPPGITLRSVAARHDGEESQVVASLRLSDPADLAAARRAVFVGLVDPSLAVRDLVRRIHARGTIQRLAYRTRTDEGGWSYAAKLGAELGVDRATSSLRRELVDAQVVNGPFPARRADCLGIE